MPKAKISEHYKQARKGYNKPQKESKSKDFQDSDNVDNKDVATLKDFDLNWRYGPCKGVDRLDRWNRAEKFGLNPPQIVKVILDRNLNDELYTKSMWDAYKIL